MQAAEGAALLRDALRLHSPGPYQLQAAIAAVHAEAPPATDTDWPQIVALYRELMRINPSAVVRLNYAVAVALAGGIDRGLTLIDEIGVGGVLDSYYLFHAARADLLRRLERLDDAASAYRRALALVTNDVERAYLRKRLQAIESSPASR
jgi:RNA polymerase sigma-70 factor (ECF subfamily)